LIFRRRKLDKSMARREMARIIIDLKQLHKRAYYYRALLESKIAENKERLSYAASDEVRSAIVRNIRMYADALKAVSYIEAVLELLIVRLETLGLLGLTVKEIVLVKEILKGIKDLTSIMPDISLISEDLKERIADLMEYFPITHSVLVMASSEAKKIMGEAEVIAEERLSSNSPTP